MRSIWKFPLVTTDTQTIRMPEKAKILTVQVQHGVPVLYTEVDTEREYEDRRIEIFGTGHPMPNNDGKCPSRIRYIGTYQVQDGYLVFHVYERKYG